LISYFIGSICTTKISKSVSRVSLKVIARQRWDVSLRHGVEVTKSVHVVIITGRIARRTNCDSSTQNFTMINAGVEYETPETVNFANFGTFYCDVAQNVGRTTQISIFLHKYESSSTQSRRFKKYYRLKMFTKHKPHAGLQKGPKNAVFVPGDLDS